MWDERIFYINQYGLKSLARSVVENRKLNDEEYYRKKYKSQIEQRKIIFIHVPKAAGTSFVKALYGFDDWTHLTATDYKKIHEEKKYDELYKIAFVRNPFERTFSAFNYLKKSQLPFDKLWAKKYIGNKNFVEFLRMLVRVGNVDRLSIEHFRKQKYFVNDDVDFLGRVENYNEDVNKLNSILSLNIENYNLNTTSKKNRHYTDEERDLILKIYKDDFDRFGYSKDLAKVETVKDIPI